MSVYTGVQVPEAAKDFGEPEVTASCELPDLGARN